MLVPFFLSTSLAICAKKTIEIIGNNIEIEGSLICVTKSVGWYLFAGLALTMQAWIGKGGQPHLHAPAYAILKMHMWCVACLKHFMVCFPIYSWFIHCLHSL